MKRLVCVLLSLVLSGGAVAQTAQEQIEKTLGSLVVQNATCAAQTIAFNTELQKVRAELVELKAAQPAGPKDVSPLVKAPQ